MELIIEIMTHLDRVGVECLVDLLDRPLPGVVQYVIGPYYMLSSELSNWIERVHLDKLNDSKPICMISLVDFIGIDYLGPSDISEMIRKLPCSINLVTLREVTSSYLRAVINKGHESWMVDQIAQLTDDLSYQSKLEVMESEDVLLYHSDIDLRKISFKNIKTLEFQNCGVKDGTSVDMKGVDDLWLVQCTEQLKNCIDLEACDVKAFHVQYLDSRFVLRDRTINTKKFRCMGYFDIQRIIFGGRCMVISSLGNQNSVRDVIGPKLHYLRIWFRKRVPPVINLNAPMLYRVEYFSTIEPPVVDRKEYLNEYTDEECLYLQQTTKLKLAHFLAPLYRIDLHNLTLLDISLSMDISPVERVFPALKTLVIQLYGEANHAPEIKADNLESLEIKTRAQFNVYSIEGTIGCYPKMKRFRFSNGPWSLITRIQVLLMIFILKWFTSRNFKTECGRLERDDL
jgi:hypothetical protein